MVFVKVRETYDLHTVRNKMTVIGIHTPKPSIIKKNFPGLLMQCKAWRPASCNVRIACASVLPLDPRGVGTTENAVAPEDVFNPILYKAMSNKGMSQLEARINGMMQTSNEPDVNGDSAIVEVNQVTDYTDEFNVYYALLADAHGWKHAMPQAGLTMTNLKPLVYEMVYNVGDSRHVNGIDNSEQFSALQRDGTNTGFGVKVILGNSKPHPFLPCTEYDSTSTNPGTAPGFEGQNGNAERTVPYLPIVCAGIIIPPSRLHELYYRMVVEWTIEFTAIRSLIEITDFPGGLNFVGSSTHYQNYSYSATKEALTGDSRSIMDKDSCMVSANVEVEKVM